MRTSLSLSIYLALAVISVVVCAAAQAPNAPTSAAKSSPQPSHAFTKQIGGLEARFDHADWQSPELLLEGLRSDYDDTRLKAFHLLGATEDDAHEIEYALNGEATLVATPWKSELLYAPLGEDSTQQAIVAVQVRNLVLAAVAVTSGKSWQRIAAFRSLCAANNSEDSYGSANGGNILANMVEIGRVHDKGFERAELILREIDFPSEGDRVLTFDDYTEYEARFRVRGMELRRVIAFQSRVRSCGGPREAQTRPMPAAGPRRLEMSSRSCSIERRWFYRYDLENVADAFVREARGEVPNPGPTNLPFATDLEAGYLRPSSCQALKFNNLTYQYEPVSIPTEKLSAGPLCESSAGSIRGTTVSPR